MLKKVFVSFLAVFIFTFTLHNAMFIKPVNAAIMTKVATAGAKKAAKEVIKDTAVEVAKDYALNEAFQIAFDAQQKYNVQENYKIVCATKLNINFECDNPVQVKSTLTEADKVAIGHQAEIELDKAITGGKGLTRWQKFLDWFLPIWLVSFGITALTYAMDPETRSLFNDIGYNALVALGFIKPVSDKTELEPVTATPEPSHARTNVSDSTKSSTYINTTNGYFTTPTYALNLTTHEVIEMYYLNGATNPLAHTVSYYLNNQPMISYSKLNNRFTWGTGYYQPNAVTVVKNGVIQSQITSFPTNYISTSGILDKKIQAIRFRLPYQVGGFWYSDVLFNTVEGDLITIQIRSGSHKFQLTSPRNLWAQTEFDTSFGIQAQATRYIDDSPFKTYNPPIAEETSFDSSVTDGKYTNESGTAFVPPSALPYTQTSTGLQLTPEQDENGERKFTDPSGQSIPEDDITVGDPNIQENPAPSPNTVTPPATQTNPNPEPIPLTPTAPPPPPPPPPKTIETLPPVMPEGESCDVGLKLPKFNPLVNTISDAFPFSIPFDLKDGFDAIFAEMGSEKPEFDYKFKFMGDEQSWKITIPDYFDSWKNFTDSFLIFIFDVGIIYAIYRFMGGAN